MEMLLSGNEAFARGVYEHGGEFASAYPGTPSTEILETLARQCKADVYCEWSINERSRSRWRSGRAGAARAPSPR